MRHAKSVSSRTPVLEVIATSVADAMEAELGGAGRLEIIRDLCRGGLTPPLELVQEILAVVRLPLRVMLRESDSYEVASEAEIESLCATARVLSGTNVDGVVLGFLRRGEVDIQLTERVLSHAPNLRATFHHAFEEVEDQILAISVLKGLKQIDRILTSGATGDWQERVLKLYRYEKEAGPDLRILAGGGMDRESIRMICQATGIREFHVGRAAREPASATGVVKAERVKALVESTGVRLNK